MFPIMLFCGLLAVLAACSGSGTPSTTTPTPTPTPGQGQRLLTSAGQQLNSAQTMHGIFTVTSSSQAFKGTIKTEIWNAKPNKSRTNVLQSTFTDVPSGLVTVTNGKQIWEYNPAKKVVYTGTNSIAAQAPLQVSAPPGRTSLS